MKLLVCLFSVSLFALSALASSGSVNAQATTISPKARLVTEQLDRMDVEQKWIAGHHIDWQTGLPDGQIEPYPGRHTHCSAFVASAAEKFGVYILSPPQHSQELLANAQNEWLATEGAREGWRPLNGPVEAQRAANRGDFVVASYHNHHDNKPGHIAIIRAGDKSVQQLALEGPNAIQAGTVNSTSISIRDGFAGHPSAWSNNEITYYAHAIKHVDPLPAQ